jgi:hypothetical protein
MSQPYISEEDRQLLTSLSEEKLIEVMMFNNRNIWRVDGLYFLGIEKEFGENAATKIDAGVWNIMGKLEARNLKKILGVENPIVPEVMNALQYTSWALDQQHKEITVKNGTGILKIFNCRTQVTRLKKGLPVFPCKQVRYNYLANFAKEMNPAITCTCVVCPPDERSGDVWCHWHFATD